MVFRAHAQAHAWKLWSGEHRGQLGCDAEMMQNQSRIELGSASIRAGILHRIF